MGLDMYFYSAPGSMDAAAIEAACDGQWAEDGFEDGEIEEIGYFRKHADLHGKLEEIWRRSHNGAEWDDFNDVYFEITPEILKELLDYGKTDPSGNYQGFFWGETNPGDWEEFREMAKAFAAEMERGRKVWYYPNW